MHLLLLAFAFQIRPLISCLYHLVEVVSLIDFLMCLATYAFKVPTGELGCLKIHHNQVSHMSAFNSM